VAINTGGVSKLKDEFLELLDKDREFRYTVAGYLGLSEVLKRLDRLEEGQNKLWEEVRDSWQVRKNSRVIKGFDDTWIRRTKQVCWINVRGVY